MMEKIKKAAKYTLNFLAIIIALYGCFDGYLPYTEEVINIGGRVVAVLSAYLLGQKAIASSDG